MFTKEDIRKLVKTINDANDLQKLDDVTLSRVFDKWWPDLEERVDGILSNVVPKDTRRLRNDREILEEILDLSRSASKIRTANSRRVSPQAFVDLREGVYGEVRLQARGLINGRLYVIAFTQRGGNLRLISLRKANKREQVLWENR